MLCWGKVPECWGTPESYLIVYMVNNKSPQTNSSYVTGTNLRSRVSGNKRIVFWCKSLPLVSTPSPQITPGSSPELPVQSAFVLLHGYWVIRCMRGAMGYPFLPAGPLHDMRCNILPLLSLLQQQIERSVIVQVPRDWAKKNVFLMFMFLFVPSPK